MSQSSRKRSTRRVQPYAWLGAGAVTVGMGVALVGGAAVAFADADASPRTTASESAESTGAASPGPRAKAPRASRVNAGPAAGADTPSRPSVPARKGRLAAADDLPEVPPAATVASDTAPVPEPPQTEAPVEANDPAPAAAATAPSAPKATPRRAARSARVTVDVAPSIADTAAAPAAVLPAPSEDPAPEMTSWLPGGTNPGTQIVPGTHVALALQEIAAAQGIITAQTWGSGNLLAGVAAIVPQVFLASAALSLQAWGATNPGAQDFLAGVAGIPLLQQIAQVTLVSTMVLPSIAEFSLGGAALFLPLVDLLGADIGAAQTEVAAARQDGKVYAVIPIRTALGTQPLVGASINGGRNATLLIDTGASGLVTTADQVGGELGTPTGSGISGFSGGLQYSYETYNLEVDLGGGAVATVPVNIVTDTENTPECPTCANSVANFEEFFSWGADGILGIGANTAGPGPAPIPTAAMPGELSNGVLLFQNFLPFGLLGFMVLGPNPLPTRVSVPGAPDAYVQVSVNGGAKQDAGAIIDSGGVFGTLNRDLYDPSFAGSDLPAGTKIAVYTADGSTLLYSYTAQASPRETPVIEDGLFNTGNAPFALGPIYLNYGFDDPYGIGSTDFSIW